MGRSISAASAGVFLLAAAAVALPSQSRDWLVADVTTPTTFAASPSDSDLLVLSNGLLSRTFFAGPSCFTTVDLELLTPPRKSFLRALAPEVNMTLNGTVVNVGSCFGQMPGHAEFFDPAAAGLGPPPRAIG